MSTVVWKFPLPVCSSADMPTGATVLSVGEQDADIVAWALCDPEAPKVSRLLTAHPTGAPLPPVLFGAAFVGTVQMESGLVFHVFDGGERSSGVRG